MPPPILLFDGVCNLCAGAVQFILQHESGKMPLMFASLQSGAGKALLAQHHLDETFIDSLVYIEDGQAFTHSDAALQVARHLKNPYRSLTFFKLLPKPLRDFLYTQIARRRYTWFGKKVACWLPTPALKARFIGE